MDRLENLISDMRFVLESLITLKNIFDSGCCNNCSNKECGYKPFWGSQVRYNCPFYKAKDEPEKDYVEEENEHDNP